MKRLGEIPIVVVKDMGDVIVCNHATRRAILSAVEAPSRFLHTTEVWGVGRPAENEPRDTGKQYDSPITDLLLAQLEAFPSVGTPDNPYYVKSHVNAPGTVRSWFRKMRAADWQRDTVLEWLWSGGFTLQSDVEERWTLFDTQKVVDRETAATYDGLLRADERYVARMKRLKFGDIVIVVDDSMPRGVIACHHGTRRAIITNISVPDGY